MKENSIEEDIKIAERFIKSIKTDKEYKKEGWHGYFNEEIVELARILEHILKELKRFENMYEAEKRIHMVRNEQLARKQQLVIKCNELENENKELKKENEKLKHKIEGQECVIETQAHNEAVYERTIARLEKENKELKEEKDVDYTTVYLKGIYDERERWDLKVKGNIKKYRKLADETYKIFRESNSKDRDSHDAGLYFDGHVSALEEII